MTGPTKLVDADAPVPVPPTLPYWDRVRHFAAVTDVRNLFHTSAQLHYAKELVRKFDESRGDHGAADAIPYETYCEAKTLVQASFHPDTGELVFLPFRMASFVPTNLAVVAGMLMAPPTTRATVFWQALNQSVNVAFNYANANKSAPMSLQEAASAYATSVVASCGVALGLTRYAGAAGVSPLLRKLIPFAAVASAGTVNVLLMRQNELRSGITVRDEDGRDLGPSQRAGALALSQVALSRVATAFPALTLPPLITSFLQSRNFIGPRGAVVTQFATIGLSLGLALPCAIALFPQTSRAPVRWLEERFQRVPRGSASLVEHVTFNKGL